MASPKLKTPASPSRTATKDDAALPLERSVGYQVRMTHRALQRYLQIKIKPHGVTLGTWYFLRSASFLTRLTSPFASIARIAVIVVGSRVPICATIRVA